MLCYKFHGTVALKTFLEINILRAVLGDLFATVSSSITEHDILRFPEENLREGARIGVPLRTQNVS